MKRWIGSSLGRSSPERGPAKNARKERPAQNAPHRTPGIGRPAENVPQSTSRRERPAENAGPTPGPSAGLRSSMPLGRCS